MKKEKENEKKEIRALGRLVAHEISNEEMDRIRGSLCVTALAGGTSCTPLPDTPDPGF